MTAWCILHMWARDGLSIRISTAWMGPAGLRSFMATCDSEHILTAIIAGQGRGPGQPQDPSPQAAGSPRGSPCPILTLCTPHLLSKLVQANAAEMVPAQLGASDPLPSPSEGHLPPSQLWWPSGPRRALTPTRSSGRCRYHNWESGH